MDGQDRLCGGLVQFRVRLIQTPVRFFTRDYPIQGICLR